jgi:hypothetical protein
VHQPQGCTTRHTTGTAWCMSHGSYGAHTLAGEIPLGPYVVWIVWRMMQPWCNPCARRERWCTHLHPVASGGGAAASALNGRGSPMDGSVPKPSPPRNKSRIQSLKEKTGEPWVEIGVLQAGRQPWGCWASSNNFRLRIRRHRRTCVPVSIGSPGVRSSEIVSGCIYSRWLYSGCSLILNTARLTQWIFLSEEPAR